MPDTEPARPFGRSLQDFQTEATQSGLLPAEETLRQAVRRGEVCQLGRGRPKERSKGNRIRAGFLRFLALGGDKATPMHERGIELYGAYIDDDLDLTGCIDIRPLLLGLCHIFGTIILRDARTHIVNLSGSRIGGLEGDGARIAGNLFLRRIDEWPFLAESEVRILGAEIGGSLDCVGGHFANPEGRGLSCDGLKVSSNALLGDGFNAEGAVRLVSAEIGDNLVCDGGRFANPKGDALICDRIKLGGTASLNDGFNAEGEVRLSLAALGDDLACRGGRFVNPEGNALSCDGIKIGGNAFLDQGFNAKGAVWLSGAEIAGDLTCYAGRFDNARPHSNITACDVTGAESRA